VPQLGDITFFVGFLIAGASYLVLCRSKIAAERTAV
jgi:cytosine/uracil/thiamine/allantoin permease